MDAFRSLALTVGLLMLAGSAGFAAEWPAFDVPRLDGIAVDGSAEDWGDRGFHVDLMASPEGRLHARDDQSAQMRIGWNDEGLLLLVTVRDDARKESPDVESLWWNDCVEIFEAETYGSQNRLQIMVAPGADPEFGRMRYRIFDHRPEEMRKGELGAELASRVTDDGYVIEAALPWSNLGIAPQIGTETALNVFVNDSDLARGPDADNERLAFYPSLESWRDPTAMHRLRLALEPSPPVRAVAVGSLTEMLRRVTVEVSATADMAGREVTVSRDGAPIAAAELQPASAGARATLRVDVPASEPLPRALTVSLGDLTLPVPLPDATQAMVRARASLEVVANPPCFAGSRFPEVGFRQPLAAERLVGPYTIEMKCYDARFEPVESPSEPGRYGAVVTITPEHGRPIERYLTLFYEPEGIPWAEANAGDLKLPESLGIPPEIAAKHRGEIAQFARQSLELAGRTGPASAAALAGLCEDKDAGGEVTRQNDVWAADRQWWVTMKRRLTGMDKVYPGPFVCPRPIEGEPAPVLHQGTPEEAGVTPEGVQAIDAVLTEWQGDTDQSFAVCIAHHGVIVLHKAYAVGDEEFTLDTPTWIASITKAMSGSLTMMLVDQGLVDLDATVDTYLPAFRGIEVKRPLRVRNLFTHTAGLWDHWGDEMNDFDQVIAMIYPDLRVGVRYEYDGAGYALAGKIAEMVSGEAIPLLYQHHLFGPLGLKHTSAVGTSADGQMTSLDLATFAQMLLNRGAYGDMRFFSEETFEKMLPVPLANLTEEAGGSDRGPGTEWTRQQMLNLPGPSPRAIGHGSAAGATLIVDPEYDLVIVMTRNAAGTNFGKYHSRFITAVYKALAD